MQHNNTPINSNNIKTFISLLEIVKKILPTHASYQNQLGESGDQISLINWKLGNDPERPHKRSKRIKLIIEEEAIDDLLECDNPNAFKIAEKRLETFIRNKMSVFNPDHNNQRNSTEPEEIWIISTHILNP